jgi:hypothetical protein
MFAGTRETFGVEVKVLVKKLGIARADVLRGEEGWRRADDGIVGSEWFEKAVMSVEQE